MEGVPRSDTVADSAKSDVLKEERDLELQGHRETIHSSSKQRLSVRRFGQLCRRG
jgi:hypothetical protein